MRMPQDAIAGVTIALIESRRSRCVGSNPPDQPLTARDQNGGFSWYLFGPDNRLQLDIAGTLGNGSWGYICGTYDKDTGPTTSVSI
jgi:hypothetical protein